MLGSGGDSVWERSNVFGKSWTVSCCFHVNSRICFSGLIYLFIYFWPYFKEEQIAVQIG